MASARHKQWGLITSAVGAAAIVAITLLPIGGGERSVTALCIFCGALGVVDFAHNVLLFVPLGFGLRLAGVPLWGAVAACVVATLGIELMQMHVVTGRDASLGDLLANATGGALGAALAHWLPLLVGPTPRQAARLAAAGAVSWVAILTAAGLALGPSATRPEYYGQWAPRLAHLARFRGTLLAARVNGAPLPRGPTWQGEHPRVRLARGELRLEATVRPGPPTPHLAPVASVFDEQRAEIALLGQDGSALVFRTRTRAGGWGLREPAVRLDGAFPVAPTNDTLHLAGERMGPRYTVAATRAGTRAERRLDVSPAAWWLLFLPFEYALGREQALATFAWTALCLLPLAYWGVAATRGARAPAAVLAAAAAVVLAAGLALAPIVVGAAPAGVDAWAGAAAAALLALRLRRRAAAALSAPDAAALERGSRAVHL